MRARQRGPDSEGQTARARQRGPDSEGPDPSLSARGRNDGAQTRPSWRDGEESPNDSPRRVHTAVACLSRRPFVFGQGFHFDARRKTRARDTFRGATHLAKASSSSIGALARFGRGKKAARKAEQTAAEQAAARAESARQRDDDRFIDEVSEELRRERMISLARRYGPFLVAGLLIIVVAVAALEYQSAADTEAARALGGDLATAAAETDPAVRAERFEAIAAQAGDGPARSIARLYAADAALEADDAERALALYDAVTEDADLAPLYRDLAALKAALARADALSPAEIEAQLDPLTDFDAPYRALALEQIGLAQARAGDLERARATLAEAIADQRATALLQQRVRLTLETFPAAASDAEAPADAAADDAGEATEAAADADPAAADAEDDAAPAGEN